MSISPRLPNLIVIGAMKAGTTSLHSYLGRHPDFFMSEIKEPHFFSDPKVYNRGVEWYKGLFITDRPFRGESSQGYTKCHADPGVPEKIHNLIPGARLIYIIRDPIERVLSHAVEFLYEVGDIGLDLNDALRKNIDTHITKTSLYFMQIEAYLRYFNENQIHILTLEDLKENRLSELNKIFEFVGASPMHDDTLFDFVMNRSDQKYMQSKLSLRLQHSSIKTVLKRAVPRKLLESLKRLAQSPLMKKPIKKPELAQDVVSELIDYFKDDVGKLRELTGKSFSNWKYSY